jgi:hypothetical protein
MRKLLALSAIAIFALTSAASAVTIKIDSDQVTLPVPPKAATYETKTTGSIGTTSTSGPNLWGDKCDPLPTAYDPFYSFCQAAVANIQSLSERSQGAEQVLKSAAVPGVPAQCVNTYKTISGPWWNPTVTTTTVTEAC